VTDFAAATATCVERLQDLIRIPSVNPPEDLGGAAGNDPTGGETAAAGYCAEVLTGAGIAAEVLEAAPGRGSCFARLPATVAEPLPPLILLSHVDVVPVEAEAWSRDPFGGELVDGMVWGRGAVDMKNMVAMELAVMELLHASGMERRRDLIFAAVADEEAGGTFGAAYWVNTRPDLFGSEAGPAAAALNEVGGYSMVLGDNRYYTIQVAEKGIIWTRLHAEGTAGHGSMPHDANPTIRLAQAVSRIAALEPSGIPPRVVEQFFAGLGLADAFAARTTSVAAARTLIDARVSDPALRRSLAAMLVDTITPTVIRSGTKMNVIPGSGMGEVDVRTLPGTDQDAILERIRAAAGPDVGVEALHRLPSVEADADAEIVGLMTDALVRADPDGTPLPMMITPGTDAKALSRLGIPTYGFAPLRLDADMPFLSLFHSHDERVPVSALAFGLPVLYEVVSRFVGVDGADR
jgi:acetylornithine deacetylase/succinyl-diaminopimelate desuccinylase-like protein